MQCQWQARLISDAFTWFRGISGSLAQVMSKEVHIIGASGYTHEDITKVVEHIAKKKTKISSMVTHVYKLEDIQEAFNKAFEAKETVKVVIDLT